MNIPSTACHQLEQTKAVIQKYTALREGFLYTMNLMKKRKTHVDDDPVYQKVFYDFIGATELLEKGMSEFWLFSIK
ncbi:hypothetical protein TNCT_711701 [Trichonephila clavata]|uniref:Uncharacterized protein n=1 Tax=Trichonephila clavata TaxID=2740835 RepID=A0A8X6FVW5_TRICU|nr:hypothetical protein TNCT_711701 [Trichonephila clavata]